MLDAQPQIVVAIPTHNNCETVGETIESVIAQTYPHWKLYVYDGGSSDSTLEVVHGFDDPRIAAAFASEKPLSMKENVQRTLTRLDGEFFQFLGSDDCLHKTCFEEKMRLATLPENSDATLLSSNRMLITKTGKRLFAVGFSRKQGKFSLNQVATAALHKLNPIGDLNAGLVRTSALQGFNFTDMCANDLEMWLHVLQHGKMVHVPKNLSYYRISSSTTTGRNFFAFYLSHLRFYRQRIKPLSDRKFTHFLAYINITLRDLAKKLIYMLN